MKKIFLMVFLLVMVAKSAGAATYYVDEKLGSDMFAGEQNSPFATIQKAANNVVAGDTVIVRDGVYYGPIEINKKGTQEKPIIFRTENRGFEKVIITNANKNIRNNIDKNLWTLYNVDKNIYVTDYTVLCNAEIDGGLNSEWLFPARVLCDEVDLLPYTTYSGLENEIINQAKNMLGYSSGYYYDHITKKLYLRLDEKYGSIDPNKHIIKVAPASYPYISDSNLKKNGWSGNGYQYDAMGNDSFNICVGDYNAPLPKAAMAADSYYVTVEGFTFETPGFCGVYLRASDCSIRGCWFRGTRAGVRGAARVRFTDEIYSKNIVVEYCDFTQFPTYSDAYELIENNCNNITVTDENTYFWWQRKAGTGGVETKVNYENGGFVSHMGEYWTLRYNYIHECFDGISYGAMRKYSQMKDGVEFEVPAEHIEIYGNKFEKCLDNCIEFENRANDIRVFENQFVDNFLPISWQPLNGTPWPTNIRIYKNLIHNTTDFNEFWKNKANYAPKAFKLGALKTQWAKYPWMRNEEWDTQNDIPKAPVTAEQDGFRVYNNTIIMPAGDFMTNVSGLGGTRMKFKNFSFHNNFILSRAKVSTINQNGNMIASIMYSNSGIEFGNNIFAPDIPGNYELTDDVLMNGALLFSPKSASFTALTRLSADPTLRQNSPLIGSGKRVEGEWNSSVDVGAIGFGESNFFNKKVGPNELK